MPSLPIRSRGFVRDAVSHEQARATRALLACGVIAGPFYIAVGAIQLFIRPGFDIRRHALSLLSNGDLGWIQIANFAITGALLLASAVGMRRALHGTRGPAADSERFTVCRSASMTADLRHKVALGLEPPSRRCSPNAAQEW